MSEQKNSDQEKESSTNEVKKTDVVKISFSTLCVIIGSVFLAYGIMLTFLPFTAILFITGIALIGLSFWKR